MNFGVMAGQFAAGTLTPDGRTVERDLPSISEQRGLE
jgi:hypothetical protein